MSLNKTIWREAIAHYQAWNEAKFIEQVLSVRQKTPSEKWQEYQDLMAFCWKLKKEPSLWEQKRNMEEWAAYYTSICRFEEWRQTYGKETAAAAAA